mgnify:CR=1 FL=1
MIAVELTGEVATGCGEGTYFTELPWAQREFKTKLGFTPAPGTFNLSLTGSVWDQWREKLLAAPGVVITPPPDFCSAKCFTVLLAEEVAGAVVFPAIKAYPSDKFEILTPVAVRATLGLSDGDLVKVKVWLDWGDGQLSLSQRRRGVPVEESAL